MTNTHLHLETIKTSQGRGWGFCANSKWPRAFIPGREAGLQQCTQVDVKSTGLHLSNYFLHELCGTYTKWDQPGLASRTNHSDLNIAHINKEGRGGWGGRLRLGKDREGLLQSQLQGTKTWRGKELLDRHQISPTGDKSPSAELGNLVLTTIQSTSLQRSVCGAGRWTPASPSCCVICLINLINIHTALDCSQERGQSAPFPPIAAWWEIP